MKKWRIYTSMQSEPYEVDADTLVVTAMGDLVFLRNRTASDGITRGHAAEGFGAATILRWEQVNPA